MMKGMWLAFNAVSTFALGTDARVGDRSNYVKSTDPLTIAQIAGPVLAEQTDEWAEGRRYLGLNILAKSRLNIVPAADINKEDLPALTA